MEFFRIPSSNGTVPVMLGYIVRIEALSNYSRIYFSNGKCLVVGKVLLWFQTNLPSDMFARVHRSHLVNKEHIQNIKGCHHNTLVLSNGDKIVMSRRKKSTMKTV